MNIKRKHCIGIQFSALNIDTMGNFYIQEWCLLGCYAVWLL
jgi:hypothetical protein